MKHTIQTQSWQLKQLLKMKQKTMKSVEINHWKTADNLVDFSIYTSLHERFHSRQLYENSQQFHFLSKYWASANKLRNLCTQNLNESNKFLFTMRVENPYPIWGNIYPSMSFRPHFDPFLTIFKVCVKSNFKLCKIKMPWLYVHDKSSRALISEKCFFLEAVELPCNLL